MTMGQVRLGATVCSSILADTGCAGIRLPASPLRPGAPQSPALGRDQAALTGLQLPYSCLQVLVLGKWGVVGAGGEVTGTASASPVISHRFVGYKSRQDEKKM